MSTRELEWFDLENRTRDLLHQQLEPVLAKAQSDREAVQNLKNYSARLEKRVHDLEVSVLGDKPQETVIANLYDICARIEGDRKQQTIRVDQELESLRENLKTLNFSIERAHVEIKNIHSQEQITEAEIVKIRELNEDNKNKILEDIQAIDIRFKELNAIYKDVALKAEERSVTAMTKAHSNGMEIGNYKREVENIRKQILEALTLIREVKGNKLEETDFHLHTGTVDVKFLRIFEEIGRIRDEIYHRDQFIDRMIPLQTATMISDSIHFTLDIPHRKRFAEFENMILKELNDYATGSDPIESREARTLKILQSMKHIEERKVKMLTDVFPVEEEKNKPKVKPIKKKQVEEVRVVEPSTLFQSYSKDLPDVEKIVDEKLKQLETLLLKTIKEEINIKHESNKNYFKASISENNALLNQVLQEFEANSKNASKETLVLTKDINFLKSATEEAKKSANALEKSVASVTKMLVCLVENAQIEQALEAQDEEDRHLMIQNYEKELQSDLVLGKPRGSPEPYSSALPSGLAIQKKCLGCGNNSSLISGVRSTVLYRPTPLIYRNKKFERPALINFRGKMVKECWEGVAKQIPWKQEDMENLVTETYKQLTFSLGAVEDEPSNLPVLNSATRNRSLHVKRMRFNKSIT